MNSSRSTHFFIAAATLAAAAGSALAQPQGVDPKTWAQIPAEVRKVINQDFPPAPITSVPPQVLARQRSAEPWRRGSNIEPKAFGQIDEFTYQLRKEDLVRWDNPNIRVPLHLDWIQDWPHPIDKRTFRKIDPRAEYEAGFVHVAFKPGTTAEAMQKDHAAAGASVTWTSEMVPLTYRVAIGRQDVAAVINTYLDMPEVLYAEPCFIMHPDQDPNDSDYGDLWGMRSADVGGSWANLAWDDWTGDPNFVVAVIDTGVQINCADLNSNQWVNPAPSPAPPYNGTDLYGWNVADNTGDVLPCGVAHGTHVAGTIGAVGNNGQLVVGVNWRCKIMTLRCNGHGDCSGLYATDQALDYAVSRGAKVSNNSYGAAGAVGQTPYSQLIAAQAAGHIFVAAAGNDGVDNDASPHYPASYDLSNIISVAAIQRNAGIASFSNFGWTSVDLGAPGVSITSTVPPCDTDVFQGTSMASPHVAGAVALVWSHYPGLEWWKIKERVCEGTYNPYVACAFTSQLNVLKALGLWVSSGGTPFSPGSRAAPMSTVVFDGTNFGPCLAFVAAPSYGTVNFMPGSGTVYAPANLTRPMTLQLPLGGAPAILVPTP